MLVAPTGFGKSLAYMAMAQLSGGRTVVLTATKALQDQLVRDFAVLGLYDVRGRSAYECTLARYVPSLAHLTRPGMTAANAPCRFGFKCPLQEAAGCPYFDRVKQARREQLVVTNYDFWLYNDIGEVDLLVMDEAHQAPDELADFLSFHLTSTMKRYLAGKMPGGEEIEEWRSWARWMAEKVKARIEREPSKPSPELAELAAGLDKIVRMLGKGEWVIERHEDGGVSFDCVNPEQFGSMLWGGAGKVCLVSATCNKMTAAAIGLHNVKEWEAKSSFPVERRPVWEIEGTVRMNFRMVEGQKRQWVACIDRIVGARPDRKGIVHTTSFERAQYFLQHSVHSQRLLLNSSANTKQVVESFKQASSPLILVSPSVTTGYDFPYTQCEFQVIGKIPFPDSRSKAAKARQERNKEWAGYQAAQTLVQSSGRGMRAPDDLCETFIVDGNFGWWYHRNRQWTPKWWQAAVRRCSIGQLPPAPERVRVR
jgi:Rad3-related DNA helicase